MKQVLVKLYFIYLHPYELHYYPFTVSLDRCNGNDITLHYPFVIASVLNKAKNVNLFKCKCINYNN